MRVLLTGGTGQLGSAIARALLAAGHEVVALVRDPTRPGQLAGLDLPRVGGDITLPPSLPPALRGVEAVVHTAGLISYARADAARLHAVNVEGTRAVLDAAAQAGVRRVVLTSSIAALGWVPPGEVGDEDTPWAWGGLGLGYFETKHAADQLVLAETRLEGVALCPGITFGAHDANLGGGRLFVQVDQGGPPVVPCGATTTAALGDVAQAHVAALTRGQPGRRYVLGGHTPTFLELYAEIAALMGRPAPTRVVGEPALVALAWWEALSASLQGRAPRVTPPLARVSSRNRRYRSDRAIAELGYQPTPLRQALGECLDWLRAQGIVKG